MAVMVAVAARLFVVAATVIITHECYQWFSDKLRSRWAYSRSPDPEIFEETTTTTTAAAYVAIPPAAEQIQFEEDVAFIKGEFASALDPIASGGGGNIDRWISNIDPRVVEKFGRVAGRIGWVVVEHYLEGFLRGSRVAREAYNAVKNELRRP